MTPQRHFHQENFTKTIICEAKVKATWMALLQLAIRVHHDKLLYFLAS
jgi:hypothetical protein